MLSIKLLNFEGIYLSHQKNNYNSFRQRFEKQALTINWKKILVEKGMHIKNATQDLNYSFTQLHNFFLIEHCLNIDWVFFVYLLWFVLRAVYTSLKKCISFAVCPPPTHKLRAEIKHLLVQPQLACLTRSADCGPPSIHPFRAFPRPCSSVIFLLCLHPTCPTNKHHIMEKGSNADPQLLHDIIRPERVDAHRSL